MIGKNASSCCFKDDVGVLHHLTAEMLLWIHYFSKLRSFRQSRSPPLPPVKLNTHPSFYSLSLCSMTFWEQIDDGVQFTSTRKFFTVVPVVLFLLASNSSDFSRQPLGVNLIVVVVLLISKLSSMHDVRILGINRY
jgi:hypothetical protein